MIRLLLVLVSLLSACAHPQAAGRDSYTNPVLDMNFADPAVIRAADGWFYAYATQGKGPAGMINIQLARSADLVGWERLGDALPDKPVWASRTQDFWAPDIIAHQGRYFLYYSAKPDAALKDPKQGLCLAVATADTPLGPFIDSGRPLQCGETFVNIDPHAFTDPATGRRWLYWGSGFGPIKVQELAADGLDFAAGSEPIDLVPVIPDQAPGNSQRLVEAAWVIERDGWYYLFYSGDNCCGRRAHYAVMVARSRRATGPFETLAEASGAANSVILEKRGRWLAPGHNAVIADAAGDHWLLYHAVDRRRPRDLPRDEINSRRVMLLDRLVWRDGWPRVAENGPSTTVQAAPRVR